MALRPAAVPFALCRVLCRVSRREQFLETVLRMYLLHCAAESRKASVRAKVEHPFLIVKRDFGFTKTRYRGMAKNLNHLNHVNVLFASANWVMRARAVALMG